MATRERSWASRQRYAVRHSDRVTIEVVHDLDYYTARRIVERDQDAGRLAEMYVDVSACGGVVVGPARA